MSPLDPALSHIGFLTGFVGSTLYTSPQCSTAFDLPLPERLLAYSHWTVEKKMISKSVGNIINSFETMETYGTHPVRAGGSFKYNVGMSRPLTRRNTVLTASLSPVPPHFVWTGQKLGSPSTAQSRCPSLGISTQESRPRGWKSIFVLPTTIELQGASKREIKSKARGSSYSRVGCGRECRGICKIPLLLMPSERSSMS